MVPLPGPTGGGKERAVHAVIDGSTDVGADVDGAAKTCDFTMESSVATACLRLRAL